MSTLSRQDKATTERHAKILKDMVKRPDNKVCADCKKNDPRWASWNIGVFVCIRCSGVHRSMGTHISKVKSVDLDAWTVEQIQSIEKWGNHRANLYWEARLKPGHIPPEHKIDSFIRSKYESRRWAMDIPLPSDPSVLESSGQAAAAEPSYSTPSPPPPVPRTESPYSLNAASARTTRQPQPHQLLSVATAGRRTPVVNQPLPPQPEATPAPPPPPAPKPQDDLFSLDFHAPTPQSHQRQLDSKTVSKDVKNDILSLYSAPAPAPTADAFGQFVGSVPQTNTSSDPFGAWGQPQATTQPSVQPTSMMGTNGTGMWGVQSGWNNPTVPSMQTQDNIWASSNMAQPLGSQATSSNNYFETSNVWGAPSSLASTTTNGDPFAQSFNTPSTAPKEKRSDAFDDIWGGFK